jgi:hypothetical protein
LTYRRFTLFSPGGLSNRIKVLLSGRVLAEACGAELRVLWPLRSSCNCPHDRLFAPDPCVETVPATVTDGLPLVAGWGASPPDLTAAPGDVVLGAYSWLLRPDLYPAHEPLWPALGPALAALRPAPEIAARVERFAAEHFAGAMLGVHLRRGDFLSAREDVCANTEQALAEIERRLTARPEARIFLATDDGAPPWHGGPIREGVREGVRERLRRRLGDRVVFTAPRSLDRNAPEAIEDALVDLLLLRRTDAIIGTARSSFSELAAFGREVPLAMTAGASDRMQRLERFTRGAGLYPLIMHAARRRLGREPESFARAWTAVRHAPVVDPIMNVVRRLVRWRPY